MRSVAGEIDAAVRAVAGLPGIVPALQRLGPAVETIAGFESTLHEIAGVVPALEQLADLGTTLEALVRLSESLESLARVGPALERLAGLGDTLDELVRVIEPITLLPTLVPTLQSLDAAIAGLEVTIGSVSETLAPLQGTTQRVGRVVDRLGKGRGHKGSTDSRS